MFLVKCLLTIINKINDPTNLDEQIVIAAWSDIELMSVSKDLEFIE